MPTLHLSTISTLDAEEAETFRQHGIPESMPFLLADDGTYLTDVNRFLRSLPAGRAKSPRTWVARAYDVLTWIEFLQSRNKDVWEAEREDVAAYWSARRSGDDSVEASTWNRAVSSLDQLYSWAQEEGLIAKSPFTHVYALQASGAEPLVVAQNTSRDRSGGRKPLKHLSVEDYVFFREVGLKGRRPDGSADPDFRGRHAYRNAAFAELLVTTGMRVTEATSVARLELPARHQGSKSFELLLPSVTTKGRKERRVKVPARVLRLVVDYQEVERSNTAARAHQAERYAHMERLTEVDNRSGITQNGTRVLWSKLPPERRCKLIALDEPLSLWLGEDGLPMTSEAWRRVFTAASQRCTRLGKPLDVNPHMLRHTFAVHMLGTLVKEQLAKAGEQPPSQVDAAYVRALGDPLRRLQAMLGHSSITTTEMYLNSVEEAQDLVESAVEAWSSTLEGEGT